jgi:hypothetical protein
MSHYLQNINGFVLRILENLIIIEKAFYWDVILRILCIGIDVEKAAVFFETLILTKLYNFTSKFSDKFKCH